MRVRACARERPLESATAPSDGASLERVRTLGGRKGSESAERPRTRRGLGAGRTLLYGRLHVLIKESAAAGRQLGRVDAERPRAGADTDGRQDFGGDQPVDRLLGQTKRCGDFVEGQEPAFSLNLPIVSMMGPIWRTAYGFSYGVDAHRTYASLSLSSRLVRDRRGRLFVELTVTTEAGRAGVRLLVLGNTFHDGQIGFLGEPTGRPPEKLGERRPRNAAR